jgi:hypothetical protein
VELCHFVMNRTGGKRIAEKCGIIWNVIESPHQKCLFWFESGRELHLINSLTFKGAQHGGGLAAGISHYLKYCLRPH